MSRLIARYYDRFMAETEEACLRDWRRTLLADARGAVLEIGAGTGASIPFYGSLVDSVTFCEPDAAMRAVLEEKLRTAPPPFEHRVLGAPAEDLPFPDASFDSLVAMLVLCSVDDPDRAVAELRRVARPDARLYYLEHVAAEPGTRRRLAQGLIEPVWKRVAGNCHLTRTTEMTIAAHFDIEEQRAESLRKAFSFTRPSIRGTAVARR